MEEPLLKTAKDKMLVLATSMPDTVGKRWSALMDNNSSSSNSLMWNWSNILDVLGVNGEAEIKFIECAVSELLKARRVLCGSYVYGYYLEDNGYNRTIFEFMQVRSY